ncbi:MAG: serine protease [Verrucomicrobiaceae bacterium]|nr:MAG: serine protease [Verrucomicrobiaceae bacterium]
MSAHSITLRSDNPPMVVGFELPPGSHARIGSAEDAEIRLPLAGMAGHACRMGRLADGRIYLADPSGGNQRFIGLPAAIPLPPYQFVAFQPQMDEAVAASAARSAPPLPVPRDSRPIRRSTMTVLAASVVIGLVAAGGVLWFMKPVPSRLRLVSAGPDVAPRAASPHSYFNASASDGSPATQAFPSEPEMELFLEYSGRAHAILVTYDADDRELSTSTGAVISPDGLVVTSMDPAKVGVKARISTDIGRWHEVTRPATIDAGANLVLFKIENYSGAGFEPGASKSMREDSPALIMHAGGQMASSFWKVRMLPRSNGATTRSLPNGGNVLSFPGNGPDCSPGSPVFDRDLKLVGIVAWVPPHIADLSARHCIPVETVRELLEKYHDAPPPLPPPPVPLADPAPGGGQPAPGRLVPEYESILPTGADKADMRFLADPDSKVLLDLSRTGKTERAVALARKLLAKYPDSPVAHLQLGNLLLDVDKKTEAEKVLREGVRISPGDYALLVIHGMALESLDKDAAARESWILATKKEPDRSDAWTLLSYSYLRVPDHDHAIPALERLRKLDPLAFDNVMDSLAPLRSSQASIRSLFKHFNLP